MRAWALILALVLAGFGGDVAAGGWSVGWSDHGHNGNWFLGYSRHGGHGHTSFGWSAPSWGYSNWGYREPWSHGYSRPAYAYTGGCGYGCGYRGYVDSSYYSNGYYGSGYYGSGYYGSYYRPGYRRTGYYGYRYSEPSRRHYGGGHRHDRWDRWDHDDHRGWRDQDRHAYRDGDHRHDNARERARRDSYRSGEGGWRRQREEW